MKLSKDGQITNAGADAIRIDVLKVKMNNCKNGQEFVVSNVEKQFNLCVVYPNQIRISKP